jgi:hypothetical protein
LTLWSERNEMARDGRSGTTRVLGGDAIDEEDAIDVEE